MLSSPSNGSTAAVRARIAASEAQAMAAQVARLGLIRRRDLSPARGVQAQRRSDSTTLTESKRRRVSWDVLQLPRPFGRRLKEFQEHSKPRQAHTQHLEDGDRATMTYEPIVPKECGEQQGLVADAWAPANKIKQELRSPVDVKIQYQAECQESSSSARGTHGTAVGPTRPWERWISAVASVSSSCQTSKKHEEAVGATPPTRMLAESSSQTLTEITLPSGLSSSALVDGSLGLYVIEFDHLPVNTSVNRISEPVATLRQGQTVLVLELGESDGRQRGRIVQPRGWISLRSSTAIFASRADSVSLQNTAKVQVHGESSALADCEIRKSSLSRLDPETLQVLEARKSSLSRPDELETREISVSKPDSECRVRRRSVERHGEDGKAQKCCLGVKRVRLNDKGKAFDPNCCGEGSSKSNANGLKIPLVGVSQATVAASEAKLGTLPAFAGLGRSAGYDHLPTATQQMRNAAARPGEVGVQLHVQSQSDDCRSEAMVPDAPLCQQASAGDPAVCCAAMLLLAELFAKQPCGWRHGSWTVATLMRRVMEMLRTQPECADELVKVALRIQPAELVIKEIGAGGAGRTLLDLLVHAVNRGAQAQSRHAAQLLAGSLAASYDEELMYANDALVLAEVLLRDLAEHAADSNACHALCYRELLRKYSCVRKHRRDESYRVLQDCAEYQKSSPAVRTICADALLIL